MTDDRPQMTRAPWPHDVQPTAAERLPWFLEQTREAQIWMLEQWETESGRAWECTMQRHADRLKDLKAQLDRLREENRWLLTHRTYGPGTVTP